MSKDRELILPDEELIVSIVTPTLNQAKTLEETICSVLAQDYGSIEYLVIDGGSTDGSIDILRKYSDRIAYWESQPDHGQAHAINKGLMKAKGDILGWLNADDLLLQDTVRRVVDNFMDDQEIDVIYGRLQRVDSRGQLIPTPVLPKDRSNYNKSIIVGECIVNQPGCFWRREIMDEVGFLNENLRYSMDYDYWIRMALAGAQFKRLPEIVAKFRLTEGSKTVSQSAEMAVEQLSVLDALLSKPNLPMTLGISSKTLSLQASQTRAAIQLHASYGNLKRGDYNSAWYWFKRAVSEYPLAIFQRRWFDLGMASIARRFIRRSG